MWRRDEHDPRRSHECGSDCNWLANKVGVEVGAIIKGLLCHAKELRLVSCKQ